MIFLSVWFCWFGTLLQDLSFCIQYGLCGVAVSITKYGISGVALVLMTLGTSTAGYLANVLPYGMDLYQSQIPRFVHSYIGIHGVSSLVAVTTMVLL